jgi:hypothetical protein
MKTSTSDENSPSGETTQKRQTIMAMDAICGRLLASNFSVRAHAPFTAHGHGQNAFLRACEAALSKCSMKENFTRIFSNFFA